MKKRILHLNLKGIYFHQIKSGEKIHEYRLMTERWKKRIVNREYDEIHIKWGYPKSDDKERILVRPWKGYESFFGFTHPHFGDHAVDVFGIVVN